MFIGDKDIVAIVNGEKISSNRVADAQETIQRQTKQIVDKSTALNQLISIILLKQESYKRGLFVTTAEVEAEMSNEILMSAKEFKKSVGKERYEEIFKGYEERLIIKMLTVQLADVEISDAEARKFFENNRDKVGEDASYEEKADEVKAYLKQGYQSTVLQELLNELREEADIEHIK